MLTIREIRSLDADVSAVRIAEIVTAIERGA
ncbi:hypothetical protein ACVME8_002186 [Bradyrhizobium diazoefficiens]